MRLSQSCASSRLLLVSFLSSLCNYCGISTSYVSLTTPSPDSGQPAVAAVVSFFYCCFTMERGSVFVPLFLLLCRRFTMEKHLGPLTFPFHPACCSSACHPLSRWRSTLDSEGYTFKWRLTRFLRYHQVREPASKSHRRMCALDGFPHTICPPHITQTPKFVNHDICRIPQTHTWSFYFTPKKMNSNDSN